jgi:hypothetical protein
MASIVSLQNLEKPQKLCPRYKVARALVGRVLHFNRMFFCLLSFGRRDGIMRGSYIIWKEGCDQKSKLMVKREKYH